MALGRSEDVKTGLVRLAFANGLFDLQTTRSGRKEWNCSLLIPKSSDYSALENAALEAATGAWGDKARKLLADGLIKSPFLDGDGKQGKSKKTGEPHAGFEGHRFIRVNSGEEYRPKLVDKKVLPITSKDQLKSGDYVFAVVHAYAWDNDEQGKGLTFGVSMIQKVKEGESLGGGGAGSPDVYFEAIEDDGDAPEETKTGAGASGLFG